MPDDPRRERSTPGKSSLFRYLLAQVVFTERKYLTKIKKSVLLSRVAHSHFFSFQSHPLSRGLAIGMFWAFMPMPLQMLPALLFCWLGFANLPIALVCVWISNPLTYLPIFYLEYKVAALLFYRGEAEEMSFAHFSGHYDEIISSAGKIYLMIIEGALVIGITAALLGYLAGFPLSRYLTSVINRRRL